MFQITIDNSVNNFKEENKMKKHYNLAANILLEQARTKLLDRPKKEKLIEQEKIYYGICNMIQTRIAGLKSDKDALSVIVPVEIFKDLGLNYSYEFNGCVPSGLNVLKSVNIVQDEEQIIIPKIELALNINTLLDSKVAERLYDEYYV